MSRIDYDVVVVGAGPAGSVTARYAALNGASVFLLERDREPGIPVRCAEGVPDVGLDEIIPVDPRWVSAKIHGARLVAPDRTFADIFAVKVGMVLERRLFDRALADLACEAGVRLMTKADVIGLERESAEIIVVRYRQLGEERDIRCHLVVGADGIESMVGRWGGMDTRISLHDVDSCAQYTLSNINFDPGVCQFHMGSDRAPGGYAWVFPKGNRIANVGLGICVEKGPKSAREYLDDFVAEYFPNASINHYVAGGVPLAVMKTISTDNLVLVGDAARQVNPLNGGGIMYSLKAGKMAGEIIGEALRKGDYSRKFLKKYDKAWHDSLGKKMDLMYMMREKYLSVSDERMNRLIASCRKVPREEMSIKSLFTQAVKDDPKIAAELAKFFLFDSFSHW